MKKERWAVVRHCLSIASRWRDGHRRRCEREARCEVVAMAGDEPNTGTLTPRHDAEAVVLDLVNPAIA